MFLKIWTFLKKWDLLKRWTLLKNWRFSRRSVIRALIGIAIVTLIYSFGILPLIHAKKKVEEEIILKKRALLKYDEFLQNRKFIEEELNRTLKQYEGVQQRLLPGETPQLGAANLQEIVKRLSEKNKISIRSFRILEPKENGVYSKVSIHIEFNPINSMLNLSQFIHDIEHHEKELMISEMDLLVFNPRMPNSIQGSLVVTGLMKGIKTKEKGRQG
jgi:hypothetical protein